MSSAAQLKKTIATATAGLLAAALLMPAAPAYAVQTTPYIVQLLPGINPAVLRQAGASAIQERFTFASDSKFRNIYSFTSVLPFSSLSARLAGTYSYLQRNRQVAKALTYTNDAGFTSNYQDIDKQWGLVKAKFLEAWDQTTGSSKTVVAIIDTGIDATHEDFVNLNFVSGYNFLTQTSIHGKVNSDDNGHGTLVTGILGANANNYYGIAGTNWQISVMPLKALDNEGKGDTAGIAESIVWAADHGANIVNLSLGGLGFDNDSTLANSIAYAYNKNLIIVAAAGNDVAKTGGDVDVSPVFPICNDNDRNMIIGVAATDQNDLKPDFSNYGKGCIDVTAPGKRILSTINYDPVSKQYAPNSYAFASGTSLAVPFVSGQAALIWSKKPELTNAQVRDRILSTAENIDSINSSQCGGGPCNGKLGAGRIDVKKSLDIVNDIPAIREGDIVKTETGKIYQISGGQKRPVSSFVKNQRFPNIVPKNFFESDVATYPEGPYAVPSESTLVKSPTEPTVYVISKGLKLPVTYQVFQQRKYAFSSVQTVSVSEINSWVNGNFLPPVEGTLVKTARKKTIFWVVGEVLHPVNFAYYIDYGLKAFPLMVVSDADIQGFPKGEAFIR